jgi:hypothetical protein
MPALRPLRPRHRVALTAADAAALTAARGDAPPRPDVGPRGAAVAARGGAGAGAGALDTSVTAVREVRSAAAGAPAGGTTGLVTGDGRQTPPSRPFYDLE